MVEAFISGWKRAFDYEGRSSRPDYWWFVLANFIVVLILAVLGSFVDIFAKLLSVYVIAQIVPHLPLTIRRLRDAGKPWPWIFIGLVPIIGGIWLIVLLVQASIAG